MEYKLLVAQSCPTLCDPMDCSLSGSMEFSRQEYWSEWPFPSPRDLLDSGIKLRLPALQADSLPSEPPRKPLLEYSCFIMLFLKGFWCISFLMHFCKDYSPSETSVYLPFWIVVSQSFSTLNSSFILHTKFAIINLCHFNYLMHVFTLLNENWCLPLQSPESSPSFF